MTTLTSKLMLCAALLAATKAHALGGLLLYGSTAVGLGLCRHIILNPARDIYNGAKNEIVSLFSAAASLFRTSDDAQNNEQADANDQIEAAPTRYFDKKTLQNIIVQSLQARPTNNNGPVILNVNVQETHSSQQTRSQPRVIFPSKEKKSTQNPLPAIAGNEPSPSFLSWIKQNKVRTACYSFGAWYISTHAYLLYLANILGSDHCWSRWKNQCTLEELYRIKQSDLIKDLFHSLELRDSTYQKETNQIVRLMRFTQEVDEEIGYLKRYQGIVRFLESTGLRRICFYCGLDPADALDRLRRLQFIKNSAYGWLNELRSQQSY